MSVASWIPDRCEIILLDCSRKTGLGIAHPVPILVLTPKTFNDRTSRVIGLPLADVPRDDTRRGPWPSHEVYADGDSSPVRRPKSFNWRRRKAAPYPAGRLSESFLAQACMALRQFV